jgi:OHCU decarboxylase
VSGVARLDALTAEAAERELLACCGSWEWARRMAAARPFADEDALLEAADRLWWELGEEAWLEAFRAHPRIGERKAEAEAGRTERERRWSAGEQAGAAGAGEETRAALAEGNRAYEARFGFVFLVCATGRTAEEMLATLRARMGNEPAEELRVAAEEQRKITRIRLRKWLEGA